MGDRGLISQTVNERIYVYWDTAGIPDNSASSPVANQPSSNGGFVTLTASNPNAHINLRSQTTIDSAIEGHDVVGDRVQLLQCVPDRDRNNSGLNWCKVHFPRSHAMG